MLYPAATPTDVTSTPACSALNACLQPQVPNRPPRAASSTRVHLVACRNKAPRECRSSNNAHCNKHCKKSLNSLQTQNYQYCLKMIHPFHSSMDDSPCLRIWRMTRRMTQQQTINPSLHRPKRINRRATTRPRVVTTRAPQPSNNHRRSRNRTRSLLQQ